MNICLLLFLTFFKIGLFTFGGGYAMIPLIKAEMLGHGWLTESEVINFIAVSESTPGPFAINMATFVGSSQGGIIGSMCATLGVVLPSFIIIFIIAKLLKNFADNRFVKGVISGINPVAIGLIISTGIAVFAGNVISNFGAIETPDFDFRSIIIAVMIGVMLAIHKIVRKKKFPAILLILVSAVFGMIVYAVPV